MIYVGYYDSPWMGRLILGSDGESLLGLWVNEQDYIWGKYESREKIEKEDLEVFAQTREWLDKYFAGEKPKISELPLAPEGGEFRQGVWEILCKIPNGKLTTYGEIARLMAQKMGKAKMSAQAVGGAVGHNPISIIVPCHRVVGTNGSLTGYASGLDIKTRLLRHEGVDIERLDDFLVESEALKG